MLDAERAPADPALAIVVELNKRGVPSPGSSWRRTARRANGWVRSAIPAMLANPLYRGQLVWTACAGCARQPTHQNAVAYRIRRASG